LSESTVVFAQILRNRDNAQVFRDVQAGGQFSTQRNDVIDAVQDFFAL
jgi:hypothetical protein